MGVIILWEYLMVNQFFFHHTSETIIDLSVKR